MVFNALVGNVASYTVPNVTPGQTLYARVVAVNNAGVEGAASAASAGTPVLDPNGDADGDGQSNAAEDLAGTDLFNAASSLRVTAVTRNTAASTIQITWTSVSGKQYQVEATNNLTTGNYTTISGVITASGTTTSFVDSAASAPKFYRVRVVPQQYRRVPAGCDDRPRTRPDRSARCTWMCARGFFQSKYWDGPESRPYQSVWTGHWRGLLRKEVDLSCRARAARRR